MKDFLIHIPNIIGMFGVVILLSAYFLLLFKKISGHSAYYFMLNFLGALMILYSLIFDWNLSAFVMELTWALISLLGMISVYVKRLKKKAIIEASH